MRELPRQSCFMRRHGREKADFTTEITERTEKKD